MMQKRRERKDKDDTRKKAKVRPTLPSVAPRRSAARRRSAFAGLADCARVNPPFSAPRLSRGPASFACARLRGAVLHMRPHPGDRPDPMGVGAGRGQRAGVGVGAWLIQAEDRDDESGI